MTYPLPYEGYERVELCGDGIAQALKLMRRFSWSDSIAYMIVVDFEVPEAFHDHMDFAPVCKMQPRLEDLSTYHQHLHESFGGASSKKVVPFLGVHHESRRHVALLKFYVEEMGCRLLKVHRI